MGGGGGGGGGSVNVSDFTDYSRVFIEQRTLNDNCKCGSANGGRGRLEWRSALEVIPNHE